MISSNKAGRYSAPPRAPRRRDSFPAAFHATRYFRSSMAVTFGRGAGPAAGRRHLAHAPPGAPAPLGKRPPISSLGRESQVSRPTRPFPRRPSNCPEVAIQMKESSASLIRLESSRITRGEAAGAASTRRGLEKRADYGISRRLQQSGAVREQLETRVLAGLSFSGTKEERAICVPSFRPITADRESAHPRVNKRRIASY